MSKPLAEKKRLAKLRGALRREYVGSAPRTRVHPDQRKEQARRRCRHAGFQE